MTCIVLGTLGTEVDLEVRRGTALRKVFQFTEADKVTPKPLPAGTTVDGWFASKRESDAAVAITFTVDEGAGTVELLIPQATVTSAMIAKAYFWDSRITEPGEDPRPLFYGKIRVIDQVKAGA